jgi:lysophospholipase L1-like esterase
MNDNTSREKLSHNTLSPQAKVVLGVIAMIATLILLLITDLMARTYLGARDAPQYELVWQSSGQKARKETVVDKRLSQGLNVLDPQLGYARPPGGDPSEPAWRWPGFRTSGDESNNAALRVVVLGGSTSDPYYEDEWGVWSETLFKSLNEGAAQPAIVYNGAVSGYSTNQELLKLIRDVPALAPDILISLSGVNDLGFSHSLRDHPMVSPYQLVTLKALADKGHQPSRFMPNLVAAIKSGGQEGTQLAVTTGSPYATTDADMWRRNIELMNAVSQQMGGRFHVFLQPAMGIDPDYAPAQPEADLYSTMLQSKPDYAEKASAFYTAARRHCTELTYCTDISDVFAGRTGLYHDPRHPNHRGNELIGDRVFETIFATRDSLAPPESALALAPDQ